ncbi:Malate transporter, aliminium toerance [Pleurostoma richardsiae]|uniref:Malate transporter, aliminium toerance n=1 Tax=Pleurostoma richardsiae TaxID=41990 RepID=A0AA38VYD9_9PEZI|nr:Malate transporter, aliminium toerance [Pleurostoma richardsiae]
MTVIAFATVSHNGTVWENYLKRFAAFMVGGTIALLVEVAVYPVKARVRLVESLSSCIHQISNMEASLAAGVDGPVHVNARDARRIAQYARAKAKAETALGAAETFVPFCLTEPRLKGSFRSLEPIYKEIIYVLHQIIDRMDNIVQLRKAYGSSVLEELNPQVYTHRRNVAASIILTLFAVSEALTVRLPLPQFLPSSRLAQLRLVNRVRDVLHHNKAAQDSLADSIIRRSRRRSGGMLHAALDEQTIRNVTRQRFLSWNAATAGQMEIIEYLEELVDLAKLLVGVNAFRSGMLERPSYRQYVRRIRERQMSVAESSTTGTALRTMTTNGTDRDKDGIPMTRVGTGRSSFLRRRRKTMSGTLDPERGDLRTFRDRWKGRQAHGDSAVDDDAEAEDIPASLEHVGHRMRQERWIMRSMSMSDAKGKSAEPGGVL